MSASNPNLVDLLAICTKMAAEGNPEEFIRKMLETSERSEGLRELMVMWRDENDESEKEDIVADIQELIEDWGQSGPEAGRRAWRA